MNHEKAGGYISRITFNNGESLDISRDDIVIFVGPNNAGKSQSLKDIYTLSEQKMPTTVISDINITKNNLPISATLEKLSEGEHRGGFTTYIVLNHRMHIYNSTDKSFLSEQYYGEYRALFVANLDTAARLTICNPPDSIPRNASKQHPIHYAAFDGKYRKWLSDSFKKAFGIEVTPNTQYGSQIPLCIGEPVQLTGQYKDEQDRQEAYLLLLGEGEDRPVLEQKIHELHLEGHVRMTGNVRNVPDYLNAMDVFAFPSLYEGMPLSIIEVQSNGLPCVISDHVPKDVFLTDLLRPLPLSDRTAWVDTICGAKREVPEKYAAQMRQSGFDTDAAMQKIYVIYEKGRQCD